MVLLTNFVIFYLIKLENVKLFNLLKINIKKNIKKKINKIIINKTAIEKQLEKSKTKEISFGKKTLRKVKSLNIFNNFNKNTTKEEFCEDFYDLKLK